MAFGPNLEIPDYAIPWLHLASEITKRSQRQNVQADNPRYTLNSDFFTKEITVSVKEKQC